MKTVDSLKLIRCLFFLYTIFGASIASAVTISFAKIPNSEMYIYLIKPTGVSKQQFDLASFINSRANEFLLERYESAGLAPMEGVAREVKDEFVYKRGLYLALKAVTVIVTNQRINPSNPNLETEHIEAMVRAYLPHSVSGEALPLEAKFKKHNVDIRNIKVEDGSFIRAIEFGNYARSPNRRRFRELYLYAERVLEDEVIHWARLNSIDSFYLQTSLFAREMVYESRGFRTIFPFDDPDLKNAKDTRLDNKSVVMTVSVDHYEELMRQRLQKMGSSASIYNLSLQPLSGAHKSTPDFSGCSYLLSRADSAQFVESR